MRAVYLGLVGRAVFLGAIVLRIETTELSLINLAQATKSLVPFRLLLNVDLRLVLCDRGCLVLFSFWQGWLFLVSLLLRAD